MLTLQNLSLQLDGKDILRQLNYSFQQGRFYLLSGDNGCGKSSLLKLICGAVKPTNGQITHRTRGNERAYLAQQSSLDTSFPINVVQAVSAGLWQRIGWRRALGAPERRALQEALQAVGLTEMADSPLGALSGGQLQRLRFARTLLQDAKFILLDEPFNAVDQQTREHLLSLLWQRHRQGVTVLLVSHDCALKSDDDFIQLRLVEGELSELSPAPSVCEVIAC
ncbi:MAG: metal ABC transporter ATP-binding protein [Pseudomonadales bacterium]